MRPKTLVNFVRCGQLLLAAAFAAYFLLVALTNITDYGTNFAFVQHVMCMDSIPPDRAVQWRAICNPAAQHCVYGLIIAWEALAGLLCAARAISACRFAGDEERFRTGMAFAILGLWCGLLLWIFAFLAVGGEWFLMWRSARWSGEATAFQMAILNGVALFLLSSRSGAWRLEPGSAE